MLFRLCCMLLCTSASLIAESTDSLWRKFSDTTNTVRRELSILSSQQRRALIDEIQILLNDMIQDGHFEDAIALEDWAMLYSGSLRTNDDNTPPKLTPRAAQNVEPSLHKHAAAKAELLQSKLPKIDDLSQQIIDLAGADNRYSQQMMRTLGGLKEKLDRYYDVAADRDPNWQPDALKHLPHNGLPNIDHVHANPDYYTRLGADFNQYWIAYREALHACKTAHRQQAEPSAVIIKKATQAWNQLCINAREANDFRALSKRTTGTNTESKASKIMAEIIATPDAERSADFIRQQLFALAQESDHFQKVLNVYRR